MKKRKMSREEWRMGLGAMLANESVRGEIIFLSIGMESRMNSFLAGYFAYDVKVSLFENVLSSRLGMAQKLDVFKNLGFRPTLKSYALLVQMYSGMNRLRNHAAHADWHEGDRVTKLADNEFIRWFIEGYPASINMMRTQLNNSFASLRRSKEYQMTEYPVSDDDDIPF